MASKKCKVTARKDPFAGLLRQIEGGGYHAVTDEIWDTLEVEGFPEEVGNAKRACYEFLELTIPPRDRASLMKLDGETVEKYNKFDARLKDIFGVTKYIDLVDYDNGRIKVVRVKPRC